MPEFQVLPFESHDSPVKMVLNLGLHCINKHGTMLVSLYCPFWMLNKTGLMLSYRVSIIFKNFTALLNTKILKNRIVHL